MTGRDEAAPAPTIGELIDYLAVKIGEAAQHGALTELLPDLTQAYLTLVEARMAMRGHT